MIKLKYALIARDEQKNRLAVVCTGQEPLAGVRQRNVTPAFHRFLLSFFTLYPQATSVETVSLAAWSAGMDVASLPQVLLASKTEEARALSPRALAYRFPGSAESRETIVCP